MEDKVMKSTHHEEIAENANGASIGKFSKKNTNEI